MSNQRLEEKNLGTITRLAIGAICAIVACALHALIIHYAGDDRVLGLPISGVIVAAFFFGLRSGVAAGVVAISYGAYLGMGSSEFAIVEVLSPFVATLTALALRRYTMFGRRPCIARAALFAMLVSLAYLSVVFVLGVNGEGQRRMLMMVYRAALPLSAFCAAVAAITAKVLGVRSEKGATLRCLYAFAAFVVLISALWSAESRACRAVGSTMMDGQVESLLTDVDYLVEPTAFRMAQSIVDDVGTLEKAVEFGAKNWVKRIHVSRVSFVDSKGIIVDSSDVKSIGQNFHDCEAAKDLLEDVVSRSKRFSSLHFHPAFVDDGTKTQYKYVAVAFPNGGCVIVADELSNYAERFDYLFELSMTDWPAGNSGTFVLTNPKTKTVVSALDEEWIGKPITETGLEAIPAETEGVGVRANVMGLDAYVRRVDISFAEMDGFVVIPVDEVMTTRDLSVLVFGMSLMVIFIFGSMLLAKIAQQQRRIKLFYAAEEERRAKDLRLAQNIQNSALPVNFEHFTSSGKVDLFARMRTAKEVGGDFFDFFSFGENKLFLIIADVSGKGVPAALFMMRTMATIRAEAHSGAPLAEILAAANDKLCVDNTSDMFVTVWGGIYDLNSGELEYVSVGHNPPYIRRVNGTVEQVTAPRALVMAALPGRHYQLNKTQLAIGDRLFLYTDGVTEAVAPDLELLGEHRLETTIAACDGSAVDTCNRVLAAIDAFAGTMPQADDITVMSLTRTANTTKGK